MYPPTPPEEGGGVRMRFTWLGPLGRMLDGITRPVDGSGGVGDNGPRLGPALFLLDSGLSGVKQPAGKNWRRRKPLHNENLGAVAKWLRQRIANPPFAGSNPAGASLVGTPAVRAGQPRFSQVAGAGLWLFLGLGLVGGRVAADCPRGVSGQLSVPESFQGRWSPEHLTA